MALGEHLAQIEALFPELFTDAPPSRTDIARYYDASAWAYAFFHSREGAVHMALSDGAGVAPQDFEGQARRVAGHLEDAPARVLEVGCGKGFNLAFLAKRLPKSDFWGFDLSAKHVASARRRVRPLPNAQVSQGDFHELSSLTDAPFDIIYAVETLCHSDDPPRLLQELASSLAPRGKLIVFDGFRRSDSEADETLARAIHVTERAMAVPRFQTRAAFENHAQNAGLTPVSSADLSPLILPNLDRLAHLAKRFFAKPRRARLLRALLSRDLTMNAAAGLLMAHTVRSGAHRYHELVFEKE